MKRLSLVSLATVAGLVPGLAPAPAHATPTAVQENVRHLKNVPGTTGGHLAIEGNRLYMGNYGIGFTIYDISNPRDPVQVGAYRPQGARADATPDAFDYEGRNIAVLGGDRTGATSMTEFVDVTDPEAPTVLHTIASTANGSAHNVDIVDERMLYLPSGGGFRIFDIRPVMQTPPAAPPLITNVSLQTLWRDSPFRDGRTLGPSFTHIHDISVYTDLSVLLPEEEWVDQDGDEIPDPTYAPKDIALVAEGGDYLGGNNRGSVYVVDITNPLQPVVRNRFLHQTGTGHHPWRYFHEVQLLDGDPHIGFVSDEDLHNGCDAGGVMSLRFSDDYTEAVELDEWFIGQGTPAAVCSAHVFSTSGDFVFMGSYNAGLQIIDFSDPTDLKRGGQYIIEGANSWGALYHQGVVYTGDFGARGLDVFEFIPNPDAKALLKAPNPASDQVGGLSEAAAACDPGNEADGVDGLWVSIPQAKQDGSGRIRALGSSEAPYDLDVWFYDEGCGLMDGQLANVLTGDEEGPVPAGAAYAVVDLWAGGPQWVYAKIT